MTSGEKKHNGWLLELGKVDYQRVLDWQRKLVKLRKDGMARDTIITVEHPPVLSIGKDGHPEKKHNQGYLRLKNHYRHPYSHHA